MRVPHIPWSLARVIRLSLALTLVVGSAVLFSGTRQSAYTPKDKAYYADINTVNFVRPGLVLKITSASIGDDGTVKARFTVTDLKGLPLDINGVQTPGSLTSSLRFVIAYIPQGQKQYKSYIVKNVTSPITNNTATQVTYDSGGTYQPMADGDYLYTFKTKVPTSFDRHATHSIGVWASRDLSEFDLSSITDADANVYSWVPDGSAVTTKRELIKDQSCEKCHDPLQAHGERRKLELCIICHQPQSVDPDTGNTVDMPVMIHKIHMGKQLPSVVAGGKYQIIGHGQSVADYSTVGYPADPRNCQSCHDQNTGAAQAAGYLKPTRAACGACHDNVNFATGENHVNLPQISDNQCASCHIPQGEMEFDASILGAHVIPRFSKDIPGLVFNITNVTNAVAGKNPVVTFTALTKAGTPVDISKARVQLVMSGPTTDYATYVSEDVTKAQGSNGTYTWTMKNAIAANATGTFSIGIEGYQTVTIMAGTTKAQSVRDAGVNKVVSFSVDGSPVQQRRQVVSLDRCNQCHSSLSLHGDNRNRIEQCVLCHNPNADDAAYRPATKQPAQTIQFAYMIHRIHTGEASPSEYTVYGYHGSTNDYTEIRYPGDRRNCSACHVDGAGQLPLQDGMIQVKSARSLLNPMGPATAACLGCHTDIATASHALSNTTDKLGEACAACHSTGNQFGIPKVHAR